MKFTGAPGWRVCLLGAVAILMFLVLYLPRFIGGSSEPAVRSSSAREQIRIFETALEVFHQEVGRYPTEEEGLEALVSRPETVDAALWKGPYLSKKSIPRDVWGNAFVYRCSGLRSKFEIISPGKDRSLGTGDDINNWDDTHPWAKYYRWPWYRGWFRISVIGLILILIVWAALLVVKEGKRE